MSTPSTGPRLRNSIRLRPVPQPASSMRGERPGAARGSAPRSRAAASGTTSGGPPCRSAPGRSSPPWEGSQLSHVSPFAAGSRPWRRRTCAQAVSAEYPRPPPPPWRSARGVATRQPFTAPDTRASAQRPSAVITERRRGRPAGGAAAAAARGPRSEGAGPGCASTRGWRRRRIYALLSLSWSARGCCPAAPSRAPTGSGAMPPWTASKPHRRAAAGRQLRAGGRGGGVPALLPVHPRGRCPTCRSGTRTSWAAGRSSPTPSRRIFSPFSLAGLRAAVLEVAGRDGGAQAVRGGVRHVPARPGAGDALRRRAAGRRGVRLRDLLRRLAGLAADQHLPADPVAAACSRSW